MRKRNNCCDKIPIVIREKSVQEECRKPIGVCQCSCRFSGEVLKNGNMETFTGNLPTFWKTDNVNLLHRVASQGNVHSGNSAIEINDEGNLYQDVAISEECFYRFSFFARGIGENVRFCATITFMNDKGLEVCGLMIMVREQDLVNSNRSYAYFNGITTRAPAGTTYARIAFNVSAPGTQRLNIDDVSFSVA